MTISHKAEELINTFSFDLKEWYRSGTNAFTSDLKQGVNRTANEACELTSTEDYRAYTLFLMGYNEAKESHKKVLTNEAVVATLVNETDAPIQTMNQAIAALKQAIIDDYKQGQDLNNDWIQSQVEAMESGTMIRISEGSKYIKIIRDNSVWGFIVATDNDNKFEYGDILKAANFKTPTRNKARGNVFTGYSINWTGPKYLK